MRLVEADALGRVLASVRAHPRVVVSGNHATPYALLAAVDANVEAYRLFALNAQPGIPLRDGVVPETVFVGPGMRGHPNLSYVPSRLSLVPRLFSTTLAPDVVVLHTTTPRSGSVSLGTEVNVLPAAVDAARARGGLVLAQLNPRMPWTSGDSVLPVEHIDVGVEADVPLVAHTPRGDADDAAREIGARVAARVPDGATLQTGIGAVPDAALAGLRGHRRLRVWTEMFSDGVMALDEAGALDAAAPVTASFVFGSQQLYDWLDGNPRVLMLRTERTNAPGLIASQPAMTSINSGLQVDLFGQVNASRIGGHIYSGFGGQSDFVGGALQSPGGQAMVALRSWHPRADSSGIVPLVDEPVTSFQPSVVVTEQGEAELWGVDEREQARRLIDHAAHPRVRDELTEEARALGLR